MTAADKAEIAAQCPKCCKALEPGLTVCECGQELEWVNMPVAIPAVPAIKTDFDHLLAFALAGDGAMQKDGNHYQRLREELLRKGYEFKRVTNFRPHSGLQGAVFENGTRAVEIASGSFLGPFTSMICRALSTP